MNAEHLRALLVDRLRLQRVRATGQNIVACCPNPQHSDRRPSWGISLLPPHMHGCFGCHYKGTLFTLLMDLGWTQNEAAALSGMTLEEKRKLPLSLDATPSKQAPVPISDEELWPYTVRAEDKDCKPFWRYLVQRGLLQSTVRKYRLHFDRKEQRVLFPWWLDDEFYGMTGRAIDPDATEKIKVYCDMLKGALLYVPKGRLHEPLVLVEGEIDALMVQQVNKHHCVAALGHGRFSKAQARLIAGALSGETPLYLFFDNDTTGRLLTEAVTQKLPRVRCRTVNWKDSNAKDPAELTDEQITLSLNRAVPVSAWRI